jgi:RNA polymerase sigma-70 factor (ECF subfamily)
VTVPQPQDATRCTLEPELELRRRIHAGEPEALQEAATSFYAGMFRYALLLVRGEAAAGEAVLGAFLRMVERHPQAAPERPLRAWFFDLCRDACLDLLGLARQFQTRGVDLVITRTELNALMTDLSPSWEEMVRREHEPRLLAWLAGVAELRTTVVFLHLFENYSFRDVAEITGIPASSVATIYYRAMSEFKGRLAQAPAGERTGWALTWREAPPELAGEIGERARALVGTLAWVEGEAAIHDPLTGRGRAARQGYRFAKDCTLEVRTGHALLRLDDGSDLWAPAGAALDFSAWAAGRRELRLARGRVLALAARDTGKKSAPFLLQTPVVSLTAPADAAFEALAENGKADVAVFYGTLDCQTEDDQARARRGDGVRVEAGGPPLISKLETFREVAAGTPKMLAASGENPKLRAACRALAKIMRVGKAEKPIRIEHDQAPKKQEQAESPAGGVKTAPPKRNQTGLLIVLLIIWVVILTLVSLYWQNRGGLHGGARSGITAAPARTGYTMPKAGVNPLATPGPRRPMTPARVPYRQPIMRNTAPQRAYVPPRYTPRPRVYPTPRPYQNQYYNQGYNQGYGR